MGALELLWELQNQHPQLSVLLTAAESNASLRHPPVHRLSGKGSLCSGLTHLPAYSARPRGSSGLHVQSLGLTV